MDLATKNDDPQPAARKLLSLGWLKEGESLGIHRELIKRIADADRKGAMDLVEQWAAEHGYQNLLVKVICPVLDKVGRLWQSEEILSLAHIYVAAKIAEDALMRLEALQADRMPDTFSRGPVIIGNAEDDCHPLGRRLVGTFLKTEGWQVHDLGIDVDPVAFVDEAVKVGAKVIGVSAMIFTTAENIRRVRFEIDDRGLRGRIQLAVGGAVFRLRPELVKEVGGDGTAADALGAPSLFSRLWDAATREEEKFL